MRELLVDLPEGVGVRAGIEASLRDAIRSGRLPAGAMLPSSRALAAELGVSRSTVTSVYELLVAEGWLATFGDPVLIVLAEEALAYNADLRVAGTRVEQAAGYASVAAAGLYPAAYLLARGGGKLSGDNSGLQGVGLTANWELDVWGRVRYGRAAADAQYASALADLEYARQSLVAMVAKSWTLAIEARLQRAVAQASPRAG